MKCGEIYFHKRFRFKDGEVGEKLFVVLFAPDHKVKSRYLICTTTTQQKKKSKNPGCQCQQALFFIPAGQEWFYEDTWIQLGSIYSYDAPTVLNDCITKEMELKSQLKEKTFREIVNCIRISNDVEQEYQDDILNNVKGKVSLYS